MPPRDLNVSLKVAAYINIVRKQNKKTFSLIAQSSFIATIYRHPPCNVTYSVCVPVACLREDWEGARICVKKNCLHSTNIIIGRLRPAKMGPVGGAEWEHSLSQAKLKNAIERGHRIQSGSGAVWKWRWPSCGGDRGGDRPSGLCGRKATVDLVIALVADS